MCGIAGFLNAGNIDSDLYPEIIVDMLQRIEYRGPDELGFYFDDQAALGTARLSIIDLKTGQQPFLDESQRYCLVYNGELYNYRELRLELEQLGRKFKTTSDTEVLLTSWIQWGEAALNRLNGGYAFVIYDLLEKSCVLVRDRFGKRPLYYSILSGALVFASEQKSFLSYPGMEFSWNVDALKSVLSIWTPLPDETVFNKLHQLPPGSFMRYASERLEIKPYYQLKLNAPPFKGTEDEAVEAVSEVLRESVRLRLRSDVEVGTYLSGGLDSSIVTALAVEESPMPVHSFSVCFEDKDFDESGQQQQVSAHLGTKHESFWVSNEQIAEDFPVSVWHAETPLFRTALVPLYSLSRLVNQAGIKVVLTGEGSDEAFLGYDIFKETYLRQRWDSLTQAEKETQVSSLYPYLKHFTKENARSLTGVYDQFCNGVDDPLFSHQLRYHNSKFVLRLVRGGAGSGMQGISNYAREQSDILSVLDPIRRTQWLEFKSLLAGYLLSSQGDRMSLANSVENRCPFLDHHVVEFADSLPQEMRLKRGYEEKHILKRAFADVLPANIVNRFKQPYRAPDAAPFIAKNRPEYIDSLLDERHLSSVEFLDADFCRRLTTKVLTAVRPEAISPRENQALVFLLSILLLDSYFVRNENSQFSKRRPVNFSRRIDGRTFARMTGRVSVPGRTA
jgi:asparagine synthase (glutamine-hydrolysing)